MAHIAEMLNTSSLAKGKNSIGLNNYIARELSPNQERSESPQSEEKHIWRMQQHTERKYGIFPMKDKLSIMTGRKSPDPETALALARSQQSERSLKKSRSKEALQPRRRKISVPELGTMTTVQEVAMDSPTIPGRPPLHERSISAPGSSWRQHIAGELVTMAPAIEEKPEDKFSEKFITRSPSPKQPLSPRSLAPLQIPESTASPPRLVGLHRSPSKSILSKDRPDVPPKVSTESPSSRTPYTPSNSATTLILNSNSNTPISAADDRISPNPWTMMIGRSPNGHSRGQSDVVATVLQPNRGHRREHSETSIMDRGRPKKRTDGRPIPRSMSKRSTSAEKRAKFEYLPPGIKPSEASSCLDDSDIESLRQQAVGQASRFEVLRAKDVESLSKELRSLDERCDYLRKTHHSLRAGRRSLHERICAYLRSPRVARFSHESMLKQEEALAELDLSIDDWVTKLEQAENRRTRVRQKLLEHVAAALILETDAMRKQNDLGMQVTMRGASGENTPPRSPTKASSPSHSPQCGRPSTPPPLLESDEIEVEQTPAKPSTVKPTAPSSIGPPPTEPLPLPIAALMPSSPTIPPVEEKLEQPKELDMTEKPQVVEEKKTQKEVTIDDRQSIISTVTSRRDVESIRIYADSDVFALLADVEAQMKGMGHEGLNKPPSDLPADNEKESKCTTDNGPLSPDYSTVLLPATSFMMASSRVVQATT